MERKQIKIWLNKYKRPIMCVRFVLMYLVFLNLAKYSSVFKTGLIPKHLFSALVISFLVMYRLLCIVFVPAIIFLWLVEINFLQRK